MSVERSHSTQAGGVPAARGPGPGLGERQGVGDADRGGVVGGQAVKEARDQSAVIAVPVSAGVARPQVVGGRGTQLDAHRLVPAGHGRASTASAAMSDLA